jgi:hypothetical protein
LPYVALHGPAPVLLPSSQLVLAAVARRATWRDQGCAVVTCYPAIRLVFQPCHDTAQTKSKC